MSPFDPATIPASAPAHTFAFYDQGAGVSVADTAQAPLKWAINTSQTGRTALLSVTVNTSPTIVTAGTYAFSVNVFPDAMTVGGSFLTEIVASIGAVDVALEASSGPAVAGVITFGAVYLTAYLAAGTVVQVIAENHDGASARTFAHATFVQRIG